MQEQVFECVCICGGRQQGVGAVGVSCPVSNSVEPEQAASVTWHELDCREGGREERKRWGFDQIKLWFQEIGA